MRKKLNQQLFVYLLILSLVITLGMYVKPLDKDDEAGLLAPSPEVAEAGFSNIVIAAPSDLSTDLSSQMPNPAPIASSIDSSIPSPLSTSTAAPITLIEQPQANPPLTQTQIVDEPAVAEEQPNTYEVTAYYLNVRTKPTAKSSIIKVVEQGTALQVKAATDNGWLELEDGGYIHGGYAKEVNQKGKVAILAMPAASNALPTNAFNDRSVERALQSESIDEEIEEELSKPTSIVESDSGLTEEHIAKIFEGTALSGHDLEQAILEIEDEYGINAYFTIAVMKLESGNGKSKLAKSKNNLFGLNAIDGDKYNKAFSFETKGDSVRKFGQLLSKNYVDKGFTTIEKVARKYCPANSKWSGLVKNIMKSDFRKL
jgi:flagellum-specific peptidoglycan hydrolase FlgJ